MLQNPQWLETTAKSLNFSNNFTMARTLKSWWRCRWACGMIHRSKEVVDDLEICCQNWPNEVLKLNISSIQFTAYILIICREREREWQMLHHNRVAIFRWFAAKFSGMVLLPKPPSFLSQWHGHTKTIQKSFYRHASTPNLSLKFRGKT